MPVPKNKKLLLPLFFLSGLSALIYEVIWTRILSLTFGSTFEALSAVVAAFMAGLAFGSYFMGKWSDKHENPLIAYSLTELGIGISSVALYYTVERIPLYAGTLFFSNYTYALEFILVFLPSVFIGATFPLMIKVYISSRNYVGEGLSLIYAVNTFGAVAGAFLTGFILIPFAGVRLTLYAAFIINLIIALISFLLMKRFTLQAQDTGHLIETCELAPSVRTANPLLRNSLLLVLGISGFASLAYQIAWTRLLTMVIGNSVYAFSTILTAFLAGISIGSLSFVKKIEGVKDKVLLLGTLQLALGLIIILFLPRMDSLPTVFLSLFKLLPANFENILLIEFIVTFSVVLLPTILMGAMFPAAARIYISSVDHIGEGLGRIYSVNTIGGIFGSFLTGFILIPFIGVQKTIFSMSALNLLSGVILIGQAESRIFRKATITVVSISFFVYYAATGRDWDKHVMNSGIYIYAKYLKKLPDSGTSLADLSREFKLVYYKEGKGGTVAVSRRAHDLSLQINGKTDAGTGDEDMKTQIMLAALPLLVHQNPEDVAVVGLGSGVTIGAVERFPVKKIDCVELLPEVVKANRYFSTFNHNALDDPRANIIIADGRSYLLAMNTKYDVIISEPSNPWITGVSNLFTREYFKIVKSRLKKGGIACQWFHLYSIDTQEVKMLLNTFHSVFPHVTVWGFSQEDVIILGSDKEIRLDESRLTQAFSRLEEYNELLRIGIRGPDDIRAAYLMGNKEIERFTKGAGLNTDDRPVIEFETPKALYRSTTMDNISAILSSAAQ